MLKKLTIHKFRSCEETTVDLDQPLSALCGKNGVGKTTILRAIEWIARAATSAAPSRWPTSETRERRSINLELILECVKYSYSIKCYSPYHKPQNLIEEFSIHDESGRPTQLFAREEAVIRMPETKRVLRTSRSTPATAVLLAQLPDDDPLLKHVRLLVSFLQGVRYYPFNDSDDTDDQNVFTASEYNDWKTQYENDGVATDSVNLRLIHLWNDKRALFEEILAIVGSNGLGLISNFDVHLTSISDSSTNRTKDMPTEDRFYIPLFQPSDSMGGSGRPLGFSDLSEGTRRIIRLVTSLIFDERSLMMLEQPEDAIHPGLLLKVIDLLRTYSDRTQILMATHSPTVIDALDPENILLVTAPRGVTQVRRLSAEDLEHARLFLQDEGSLSEFLGPMVDELSLEDVG